MQINFIKLAEMKEDMMELTIRYFPDTSFKQFETFFNQIIYPIYLFLGGMKPKQHPILKKRIKMITDDCSKRGETVLHIVYSKTKKLNKFFCISFFDNVFFILFLFIFSFLPVSIRFKILPPLTSLILIIISVIIMFFFLVFFSLLFYDLLEYHDRNNCYIFTKDNIYHLSKKFNFFQKINEVFDYHKVQYMVFDLKYIDKVEFSFPSSYQFCQMNNIGILRIYWNHKKYMEENNVITKKYEEEIYFRGS